MVIHSSFKYNKAVSLCLPGYLCQGRLLTLEAAR